MTTRGLKACGLAARTALGALLASGASVHAMPPCAAATITIVAINRSETSTVTVPVSGARAIAPFACDPGDLATSYDTVVTCEGFGTVRCTPDIGGRAPGPWVHRIAVDLAAPDPAHVRAMRGVVLAGTTVPAVNTVPWTLFGGTFSVTDATADALHATLQDALSYTETHPGLEALVAFDPSAFPSGTETTIHGSPTTPCANTPCCACNDVAHCLEGSGVTIDALDPDGDAGRVAIAVDADPKTVVRVCGSGNTLRGLTLRGSSDTSNQHDTISIAGVTSGGNSVEQCTVVGPRKGDGIGIEGDPPSNAPAPENTIVASEILMARDRGVKVDYGGVAWIERSCIHDNDNGGIQATLGGTVTAVENVVQHNVGVGTQSVNGFSIGVPGCVDSQFLNVLMTRGNVVRFHGERGISVVNNARARLADDVVTENYWAGLRVVTALRGIAPDVVARGGLFACNHAPGLCDQSSRVCRDDTECPPGVLCLPSGTATGVGAALDQNCFRPVCDMDGQPDGCECHPELACVLPAVDLGLDESTDAGRNAFTANGNPLSPDEPVNVSSELTALVVPARGNQWEHCTTPIPAADPTLCNVLQVQLKDIRPSDSALDVGTPASQDAGPPPVVTEISPPRPRQGDLVRLYGGPFDAIDGAACAPDGLPADRCSVRNPAVVAANAGPNGHNVVAVTMDGVTYDAPVHQVTPSMLVVEMPVDCDAPGTIAVTRDGAPGPPTVLCDPSECDGHPGDPCDDGSACTVDDTCDAHGACTGALACTTSTSSLVPTTSSAPGASTTSTTAAPASTTSSTQAAATSTTSSSTSPTPTTSPPAGCGEGPSLVSISCRLERFATEVRAAVSNARLRTRVLAGVESARHRIDRACAAGRTQAARRKIAAAVRTLGSTTQTIRATDRLSPEAATLLLDALDPIVADLRAARRTPICS